MGCNCTKSGKLTARRLQVQHIADSTTAVPGDQATPPSRDPVVNEATPQGREPAGLENELLDIPSPNVAPPPSLMQVRAFPRKVSIVQQAEKSHVIEVSVDEMAKTLSEYHGISKEQALEALRWSNFDPEEAAALIVQTAEIELFAKEQNSAQPFTEIPSSSSNGMVSSSDIASNKRHRLFTLLQSRRTVGDAAHHPAALLANIAKIVLEAKQAQKDLNQDQQSRKRPLSKETAQAQQPTVKISTSPSTEEVLSSSSIGAKLARKDTHHIPQLAELTPQSRRIAYFASKYDVKKSMSDVSSPLTHQPLLSNTPSNLADVILESSLMGQYVMPPWEDHDPDIRNNFWREAPAHKTVSPDAMTFLTEGVHCKANQNRRLIEEISPDASDPGLTPRRSSFSQDAPYDICTYNGVPGPSDEVDSQTLKEFRVSVSDGWNQLGDDKWTDPDGRIALSEKQLSKIYEWRRITELCVPFPSTKDAQGRKDTSVASVTVGPDGTPLKPGDPLYPVLLMDRPRARAIRQGFVGDCSFLSSLASLAEYEGRLKSPVISSLIYPQIQTKGERGQIKVEPVINENGMYACKLHFNGISRKVLVDDFVPIRKDGKLLAAHSANKREMWVTILEKAFVKLMGGSYFMHGSNPGADLYHLTGWIPETIPFRKDIHTGSPAFYSPVVTGGEESSQLSRDPRWDLVWRQLHLGFSRGSCVACLGTSEVADAAPSGLDFPEGVSISSGIVARHAYSILACKEVCGKKLLYVRNPWACVRWKGKYAPGDSNWTPDLAAACNYDFRGALKSDNGSFWIEWQDVIRWFSHLYLCWNSLFFPFEYTIHSRWGVSQHLHSSLLIDDSHSVAYNPQFHLRIAPLIIEDLPAHHRLEDDLTDIWILLSRHVRDRKKDLFQKYIAVHVYSSDQRVCCPPVPVQQGVYSNGECALMRMRVRRRRVFAHSLPPHELMEWRTLNAQSVHPSAQPPIIDPSSSGGCPPIVQDQGFMLIVSQYSQKGTFNFTLKLYGSVPMKITEVLPLVSSTEWTTLSQLGEWTPANAGGCSNDIWSYFKNPHYRLDLPRPCTARIFLECPLELSINVRVLRSPFSSARLLRTRKALSSGPYRAACCYLEAELGAGPHTLILSNFKAGDCGQYQLRIHVSIPSAESASLTPLPQRLIQMKDQGGLLLPSGDAYLEQRNSNRVTHHLSRIPQSESFLLQRGSTRNLALEPLPSPHVHPPPPPFRSVSCQGGGRNAWFFGIYRIDIEDPVAPIALRLEVLELAPNRSVFPSLCVLFQLSPSHPLRYSKCPCVEAGLLPFSFASLPTPSPFLDENQVGILKRSDLEGGLSECGNTPSTAAAQLYTRQGLLYLSHLRLFHPTIVQGSYYVLVSTIPQQMIQSRHIMSPRVETETSSAPPCGMFRLHAISDRKLSFSPL